MIKDIHSAVTIDVGWIGPSLSEISDQDIVIKDIYTAISIYVAADLRRANRNCLANRRGYRAKVCGAVLYSWSTRVCLVLSC